MPAACDELHDETCEEGPGVANWDISARRVPNDRRRPLAPSRRDALRSAADASREPAALSGSAAGLGLRGRTGALGGLLALVGELHGELLRERESSRLEPPLQRGAPAARPRGLPLCSGRLGG